MKAICTKLACFLLVLLVSGVAMAESITSPNGQLQLNFSVNAQGEPVYELSYKGKPVINPSKLGLELKNDPRSDEWLHDGGCKDFHFRRDLGTGMG